MQAALIPSLTSGALTVWNTWNKNRSAEATTTTTTTNTQL